MRIYKLIVKQHTGDHAKARTRRIRTHTENTVRTLVHSLSLSLIDCKFLMNTTTTKKQKITNTVTRSLDRETFDHTRASKQSDLNLSAARSLTIHL